MEGSAECGGVSGGEMASRRGGPRARGGSAVQHGSERCRKTYCIMHNRSLFIIRNELFDMFYSTFNIRR